jgi:hypothetical protein
MEKIKTGLAADFKDLHRGAAKGATRWCRKAATTC